MKLIAHRGNINGPNLDKENHPDYIKSALNYGYDAEIDVWYLNKKWYLGHDLPQYEVKFDFLILNNLWLHAKNGEALHELIKDERCNVFYHTDEDWILTSKRFIWTQPTKNLYSGSICVMPELGYTGNINSCFGICTDYVYVYEYAQKT